MTTPEIYDKLTSKEYDFLRTDRILKDNIILLGVGGSHSYGTNTPESDLDIRGVAVRCKRDILVGNHFEQVVNNPTDTTVYEFEKFISLLAGCNPNVIELLGLKPEHYIHLSEEGKLLLDNSYLFLSKKAINSFGGYAMAQLNRLCNKSGRIMEETRSNEIRSMDKALLALKRDGIIDSCVNVFEYDNQIKVSIHSEMNLQDYVKLSQTLLNVHSDYMRSDRNDKAIAHGKLSKHQMHLVRLYLMGIDILKDGKIITYREKEHDLLMDIRNGKYLDKNSCPTDEFMKYLTDLKLKFEVACAKTCLPDKPNMDKINDLVEEINLKKFRKEN